MYDVYAQMPSEFKDNSYDNGALIASATDEDLIKKTPNSFLNHPATPDELELMKQWLETKSFTVGNYLFLSMKPLVSRFEIHCSNVNGFDFTDV
ncbi:hypothetical protein D0T85_22260 [Bacteroides sp. 519]|nr:hypothetical protein [Bacteroides sp. 519]